MKRSVLYTILAWVLALTSVLAPMPNWLSRGIQITGSGTGLSVAQAAKLYIDITATGSELDISDNVSAWDVGTVSANDEVSTSITWGRITNNTSEEVSIRVYGNDMKDAATGTTKTWTLATSIGAATFAMKVGLDDDDDTFDITVRRCGYTPYNMLSYNADTTLDSEGTWDYGLKFLAPSSSVGNEAMIMCDISGDHTDDSDNGLVFAAEIPA